MNNKWPDSFDFEADQVCQSVFRSFIEGQIENLKAYDARRAKDATYIFHQHARRVAENARKVCLHMGLGTSVANNMYWALLPHDIGKTLLPVNVWDSPDKPDNMMKRLRRSHTLLGAQIAVEALGAERHPFKDLMLDIMVNHHEQMDGGGYQGKKAEDLSLPVRLSAIVEAFDGWSISRPHFGARDVSVPGVLKRMREEKSGMFDPDLFNAFAEMMMEEYKKRA